jgi:hypothetical protein
MERFKRRKEREFEKEAPRWAYHEAAHVCVGLGYGRKVVQVNIGVTLGDASSSWDWFGQTQFEPIRKLDIWHDRDLAEEQAVIILAGDIATARYRGSKRCPRFDKPGSDWENLEQCIFPHALKFTVTFAPAVVKAYFQYLVERAKYATQFSWHEIEALAAELLKRRTMTGDQVEAFFKKKRVKPTENLEASNPRTLKQAVYGR